MLEKIGGDIGGGPSIAFTRKAVVDETFIRDSTNWCKSIVGNYASQLYPFSICRAMPTGLYAKWEFDSEQGKVEQRQHKSKSSGNMVMSHFQRVRPQCKVERFFTTDTQKKIDAFSLMAYVDTATLCLKRWGVISFLLLSRSSSFSH